MKIGEHKVKRNYQLIQMVVDAFSVLILIVIFQCLITFREALEQFNQQDILAYNPEVSSEHLRTWLPTIVWGVLAIVFVGVSIFFTFKNRKLPKKYKINAKNAQKYSDIIITAITCIRIPVLLAIFDILYIHQQRILNSQASLFSLQVILDAVLVAIIICFSRHRIRAIEPKEDENEKSHTIIQG